MNSTGRATFSLFLKKYLSPFDLQRLNKKDKIGFMKSKALPNTEIYVSCGFGAQDPCRSRYQMLSKIETKHNYIKSIFRLARLKSSRKIQHSH